MTNTKTTKRALWSSVLALFLCFAMLLGTTYAWFTDSVKSANNVIKSGNLDVILEYWNGTDWADVEGKSDILTGDLWEPGYVDVAYLRFKNNGTLALKYQLGVNIVEEVKGVNVDGEEFLLSDYIYYDVVEGKEPEFATRDDAMANATETTKISVDYAKQGTLGAQSEYNYLAMIVYMPKTVGNVANHNGTDVPQIDLGINILATQMANEEDGFGTDYDKDAWMEGWKVYSADDLQAAINNGETNITLMNDIGTDTLTIPAGVAVNLNGNTLSAEWIVTEGAASVVNGTVALPADSYIYSDITLENVVIDSDKVSVMAYTDGTIVLKNVVFKNTTNSNPLQNYGGTLILDNVTVAQEGDANTAWYSSALQVINEIAQNDAGKWQTISQANTTVNGGTYTGKKALQISAPGGNVTINGGTFVGSEYVIQDDFAPQNYMDGANYTSKITINGGDFTGAIKVSKATELVIYGGTFTNTTIDDAKGTATVKIYGGTFTEDPSAYVADGYKVVNNGGLYYVTGVDADLYIANVEQLKDFAASVNAGTSYKNKVVSLLADINLNNEVWTPVGISSQKGFYGTFDGQNHTISNFMLTTSSGNYGAGFFGNLLGGAVVKNVNFDSVSYAVRSNVVGVVAGYLYGSATFENINVTNANVCSFGKVGGILGMAADPGAHTLTLTNCSVEGIIGGGYNVGGLVGLVLTGVTVNVTDCDTDVTFYMNDSGYNCVYSKNKEGGWTWVYSDTALYAGVAEQYCYYDANQDEHCMGAVQNMYFIADDLAALQAALNSGGNILMTADITGNVTVTEKNGVKVTLDGQGHTYTGYITINGGSARNTDNATVIKNVNFEAETLADGVDAFISLGGNDSIRYTDNVTIENCTFTGNGLVAVKSYTGGCHNVTLKELTVNKGMHSLCQLKNVETGLKIVDCKVYSKNGANINNSHSLEMDGCTFDVQGYAVRFGESNGSYDEVYTIKNSTLKSACAESGDAVLEFRAGAASSTLTLTNVTIDGTIETKGTTADTVITKN